MPLEDILPHTASVDPVAAELTSELGGKGNGAVGSHMMLCGQEERWKEKMELALQGYIPGDRLLATL